LSTVPRAAAPAADAPPSPVEAITLRLLQVEEAIAALESERFGLRANLIALLGEGKHEVAGSKLDIRRQRRFNADKAVEVLPPELLAACRREVIDSAQARRVLPPDLYAACQVETGSNPALRLL
jgi:hypothetical protein